MVTIKVESKDEFDFLKTAFEHAWKIRKCEANDIFNVAMQINALSLENQTLELTEKQAEVFRVVMQLYNDVIADNVEWSYDFIKQLPCKAKNVQPFYEMLRDYHLDDLAKDALALFRYWLTQDWGYFNSELLDLIERTRNLDWFSVRTWCIKELPSNGTTTEDEIAYYRQEYCK